MKILDILFVVVFSPLILLAWTIDAWNESEWE